MSISTYRLRFWYFAGYSMGILLGKKAAQTKSKELAIKATSKEIKRIMDNLTKAVTI